VGIDRPDGGDLPPEEHSGRSADGGDGDRAETRSRQEYYDDLRAAVAKNARAAAEPLQQAASGKPWDEVTGWSARVWAEYRRKFPPEERAPVDRPVNEEMDQECDQIAERERGKISPALLEVASRDPDRHLAGFEHRLKGRDRIQEKVADRMEEKSISPKDALSLIPDTIRYTFQYEEARYSQGVRADTARLEEQGFELTTRKNSWSAEQYRGINSQWVDPDSGQRFEVQFHTRISYEAKQITHDAYERLRSGQADELEEMVLEAFQRKVTAEIPVPPGATDIPDYPKREQDAR
jgi:hypothetical protein